MNIVTPVTPVTPAHEVSGLLETVHGLTVRYYKRDTRVITITADAAARRFADNSNPALLRVVARYPNGRTVYSVDVVGVVGGWTVQFDQFDDAPAPPAAQPIPPAKVTALSLSELEAAPCGDDGRLAWEAALVAADDARVVTGDDGLDHYL